MFLHKSVCTEKFEHNKKLKLLKDNIITLSQFLLLIDNNDPFMIMGNAIIDKDYQTEFIHEWKNSNKNIIPINHNIQNNTTLSMQDILDHFEIFKKNYPEFKNLYNEFFSILNTATCKPCIKNKYLFAIIKNIHDIYTTDTRELSDEDRKFILAAIKKYYPIDDLTNGIIPLDETNKFDLDWIKDNTEYGLGYDLIDGLTNCFECVKKHLSRAKILFEEMELGYPDHKKMMFNEFTEANKDIEEAYSLYWDTIGNLDQASCELAGQISDLPIDHRMDLIELANIIRTARLAFQADITKVPNWNKLRVEVQRMQNKINKELNIKELKQNEKAINNN